LVFYSSVSNKFVDQGMIKSRLMKQAGNEAHMREKEIACKFVV
jgi:hypothetical protein